MTALYLDDIAQKMTRCLHHELTDQFSLGKMLQTPEDLARDHNIRITDMLVSTDLWDDARRGIGPDVLPFVHLHEPKAEPAPVAQIMGYNIWLIDQLPAEHPAHRYFANGRSCAYLWTSGFQLFQYAGNRETVDKLAPFTTEQLQAEINRRRNLRN